MLGNMDCTVWLKRSAFSLVPLGGMQDLPCSLGKSWEKRKGWLSCGRLSSNGIEEGCLHLFPFPALLFLIFGEDGNKSTEFGFGDVVHDHAKLQALVDQTAESLTQTTAV